MAVGRGAARVSVLLLAAAILVVAAGPLLSNDIWWHLAMGEVYASQGPWPDADPLLHTARPEAPIQHEWLFGIAVHLVEATLGFPGLRVAHAVAVVAVLLLGGSVLRRAAGAMEPAYLATAAFAVLAWWRLIQLRPDLVSILATLALWRLVLEADEPPSRRRVVACAVLLGVWANLHSLFAIGLLLLAAAALGTELRRLLLVWLGAAEAAAREGVRRARLTAALALGFGATLTNPRGIEQHLTFLRSSRESGIWRISDEWRPFPLLGPEGQMPSLGVLEWALGVAVVGGFLVAAAIAGARFLQRSSPRSLERLAPVRLALGAASIVAFATSIRFLWLGVFAMVYALHVARLGRGLAWPHAARTACAAAAVGLALVFPLASSYPIVLANLPTAPRDWLNAPYTPVKYPVTAVQFLCDAGLEGKLFNSYGDGGFLGYWLAPRLRTFVDSRTEHYTTEVLDAYLRIKKRRGSTDAGRILEGYGIDVFLGTGYPTPHAPAGTDFTGAHLEGVPGWVLVSRSVSHAVWLRRNARNAANLARVSAFWARRGVPFDPGTGLDASLLVGEKLPWAVQRALVPADLPGILAGRGSDDPARRFQALDRLGLVLALLGSHEEAIGTARQALALRPDAAGPRRRLVYALLRSDRVGAARRAARAGLRDGAEREAARAVMRRVNAFAAVRERGGARSAQATLDRFPLLSGPEQAWILADQGDVFVHPASCPRAGGGEGS